MWPSPQLPRTLEAALRDLRDDKERVRLSALQDLLRATPLPAPDVVCYAVEKILREDPLVTLRAEAAVTLADMAATASIPALIDASTSSNDRLRARALLGLGELMTQPAADATAAKPFDLAPQRKMVLAAVQRALSAASAEVRFQALAALHRLAPKDLFSDVQRHAHDGDEEIRHLALRIAEDLWLKKWGQVPRKTFVKLANTATQDAAPRVRLGAALLLNALGEAGATTVIADSINARLRPKDPTDEQMAIQLCGEDNIVEATPGLRKRAFGGWLGGKDPFQWQARIALTRLGNPRARAAIIRGLSSFWREERTMAVVAAGEAELVATTATIEAMVGADHRADPDTVQAALERLRARQNSEPAS